MRAILQLPPSLVLSTSTSTLYRFLGTVYSWERFRGGAVVEVGANRERRSVVGMHSFEYIAGKGTGLNFLGWNDSKKEMMAGNLTFWGCRHLPPELTEIELCV
jgi:hypothetical protein